MKTKTLGTSAAAAELEEAAEEFEQGAESRFRQAEGEVREALSASEEFVREHPTQSALIAAGVGFLIAQLPVRILAAGLIKGTLLLLKPVAVLYALSRLIGDVRVQEPRQPPLEPETP